MSKKGKRIKWTEKMNSDVLQCKIRAQEIIFNDKPLNQNGRKKGYTLVMKELWEEMGYENLGLTCQNLRDQASRIEKSQDSSNTTISTQETQEIAGITDNLGDNEGEYATSQPRPSRNLHTTISQSLETPYEELNEQDENNQGTIQPNLPAFDILPSQIKEKSWGNLTYDGFCKEINYIYEEIVHFKRNIFNIPSGKAGKDFVAELTYWLKQFNTNADLNQIAFKAFMVLPSIILQKPSATSKSKEHSAAIERRLSLWRQGDLSILMKEVRFIQARFNSSRKARSMDDISKVFAKLIMQGKISAALKILDRETSSGILPLSPTVIEELKKKHPPSADIVDESLLYGPLDVTPPGIFELIDEQMIYNAAMKTKGSAGPSGMDAELYRRILCSKNFNIEGKQLREEVATMTRNLLTFSYHPSLLEGYTSCRLIPLNKDPGVRPIGVGEVLRRIIGKTISNFFKEELKEAAGPLQVCAGFSGGAEAAIHAMNSIFEEEDTDAVLLIDATNAFNQMNRLAAMHNIQIKLKEISLYVINTYRSPSRLFICGGGEILSQEGTTQGDPLAMPWYSVNTSIIIQALRNSIPTVKQVWLADDSAGAGQISSLFDWYKYLEKEGLKYGYLVNGSKSWLITKSESLATEAKLVFGSEVNITSEGKRHLGAVIGSKSYKDTFCNEKISKWKDELETLAEIAKNQPQSAYIAFTKGYRNKFTYFMRTIDSFEDYIEPIDEVINEMLLPALFGQTEPLPKDLSGILSMRPAQGGLGIPCLEEDSPQQYSASKIITASHADAIISQTLKADLETEGIKKQQQSVKAENSRIKLEQIDASLPPDLLRQVNQARDKGSSNWLNAIPFEEQGLVLNKQEFKDALRLRYNLPLHDLPNACPCGSPFNVNHALSCKKGGFVAQRHDNVRDLLTTLLCKVCHNVQAEPKLIPLNDEKFKLKSTTTSQDARLDIKAGGFWQRGVTAFFDVRVSHVNSKCNQNKSTSTIFKEQEKEKKRKYEERILDVEMGSFTPLVFGTNGGMGTECQMFLKALAEKISRKTNEPYAETITYIRTKLSFEILRSINLCVRGSRVPFYKNNDFLFDFKLNVNTTEIK